MMSRCPHRMKHFRTLFTLLRVLFEKVRTESVNIICKVQLTQTVNVSRVKLSFFGCKSRSYMLFILFNNNQRFGLFTGLMAMGHNHAWLSVLHGICKEAK